MSVHWLSRDELDHKAIATISKVNQVLDIGCGLRPQKIIMPQVHICCEPYAEYAQELVKRFANTPRIFVVQSTAKEFLEKLPDNSVDTIFMLDVIEHIEKQEAQGILENCNRVAQQQIVLFTPLGFLEQDYELGDEDGWGFRGGYWQKHRSGWVPADFDESWEIFACKDYHIFNGKGEPLQPPAGALWAVKTMETVKSRDSQRFGIVSTSLPPSTDYQSIQVKKLVEPLAPFSYSAISNKNYDYYQSHELAIDSTLPTQYHYLHTNKAIHPQYSIFRKLVNEIVYFYSTIRQYTKQLLQIIKEDDIDVLLLMSSSSLILIIASHRASKKLNKQLIICRSVGAQNEGRFKNTIRQYIFRQNTIVTEEQASIVIQNL